MSHNIEHFSFKENCNRKEVQEKCNHYAAMQDWQEGCGGVSNIRWLDNVGICDTYDDAVKFIETHDRSCYDCLAVRYRKAPDKHSAAYNKAADQVKTYYGKYSELESAIHYKGCKSSFVGCKKCGSKLSTAYINSNKCPLCHTDLRPQTTLDKIKSYKDKYNEATKCLEEISRKETQKSSNIMWLVKIEFHT